jgi:hypothetical protein
MTETQKTFVALEKQKEQIKLFQKDFQVALEALQQELGTDGHFQDDDGTVYQLEVPDGKFVYFDKLGYKRTRREGEVRGDLALTKAQELGYKLPDLKKVDKK